jgi:hypothetical protein
MPDSQQIKTKLDIQGAVIGPGDENYEESLRLWFDTCYRRAVRGPYLAMLMLMMLMMMMILSPANTANVPRPPLSAPKPPTT